MAFSKVLSTAELPPGAARRVAIGSRVVALFNVDGEFYAIDDSCTHAGASLSEGSISDCHVMCPFHGAEFDLRTGEALTPPAFEKVSAYPVVVSGNEISVDIG